MESPTDPTFTEKVKIVLQRNKRTVKLVRVSTLNLVIGAYFAWATYRFIDLSELFNTTCLARRIQNIIHSHSSYQNIMVILRSGNRKLPTLDIARAIVASSGAMGTECCYC